MPDLFSDGARYPSRGWRARAAEFGQQRSDGGARMRACPQCEGNGVYFDEPETGDSFRRPRICRQCPAFRQLQESGLL